MHNNTIILARKQKNKLFLFIFVLCKCLQQRTLTTCICKKVFFCVLLLVNVSTLTDRQIAEDLIVLIATTFHRAYWAHARGVSQTAILIDYDIEGAANLDLDRDVFNTGRKTIVSACAAVDDRIDYTTAHNYLMQNIHEGVQKLLKTRTRKEAHHG
jgi:hypothetical protein